MSKIPTAEEKLKANFYNGSFIEIHSGDLEDIKNIMIKFAKLHVEATLKAAYINSIVEEQKIYDPLNGDSWNQYVIKQESILDAYPLENIK